MKSETALQLIQTLLLVTILILVWVPSSNPGSLRWQSEYAYVIIEVKAWVDVNGTYGFEPIAMVRMVPLMSEVDSEGTYNWVHEPFRLDNRYGYKFIAPEEFYGRRFLFWQSQKTGMIVPNRILVLKPGFSSDTIWQNYG